MSVPEQTRDELNSLAESASSTITAAAIDAIHLRHWIQTATLEDGKVITFRAAKDAEGNDVLDVKATRR